MHVAIPFFLTNFSSMEVYRIYCLVNIFLASCLALGIFEEYFFSLARSKSCSDATGKYKNGGKAPLKRCRIFSLQHFAARWSQARAIFLRRGVGYFLFNLFDFFMGRVDGQERKKQSLNIKQQRLSLSSSRTKKNAHCHQTLRVRFSLSRTNPRT